MSSSPASNNNKEILLGSIVERLQLGKYKNVIVATGAGISTSCGIPDFRSPTGLYSQLGAYNLTSPTDMFDIDFFKENPVPFYTFAKELYPSGVYRPSPCHHFIRLLNDKGCLLRCYTQNIDSLELIAQLPKDKLVQCHGSFETASCIGSRHHPVNKEDMREAIFGSKIITCNKCGSLVKPDIVFFGEPLPERFDNLSKKDFNKCDLLIVMGTSLQVRPFSDIINQVPFDCPRILVNMEVAGERMSDAELDAQFRKKLAETTITNTTNTNTMAINAFNQYKRNSKLGMDFKNNWSRDFFLEGSCDDTILKLVKHLKWNDDLYKLQQQDDKKQQQR